jgi:murein DD-endopeptidase MepM/ murein hydrolase activator NlpD
MKRGSAAREDTRAGELFAERRLYLFREGRSRLLVLGRGAQVTLALALFLLTAGLGFAFTSHLLMQHQLAEREREIARLVRAQDEQIRASGRERASLRATIGDLQQAADNQRVAIGRLTELHQVIKDELAQSELRLAEFAEERDAALSLATSLGQGVQDAETWLRSTVREKAALTARLASSEARIAALAGEREEARRAEKGLRWELEMLEAQLARMSDAREAQSAWFRGWVGGQAGAIETLLEDAGIAIEPLLARALEENGNGQGGPFVALAEDPESVLVPASLAFDLDGDLARMVAMQRLVAVLPLATPLDQFYLTSDFGVRRDPITRRQALHAGIDMGAPAGTPILATAPGRVLRAGRAGPYGIMVEIDHGLGITTRYAHLREVSVEAGVWVDFRQEVGIIGSTGRATGRHLHYEIRIDDEAIDPAAFLDAGRHILHVFRS